MPFTQPYIPKVTVNVTPTLVSEVDFFFWPTISGEKYAPTLSNGAAYDVSNPYPMYRLGITVGTQITFPRIPRYKRGATSGTITETSKIWFGVMASGSAQDYQWSAANNGPGIRFSWVAAGWCQIKLTGAGITAATLLDTLSGDPNGWLNGYFTLTRSISTPTNAAGACTFSWQITRDSDGLTVSTSQVMAAYGPTCWGPVMTYSTGPGASGGLGLSNVYVGYS